MTDHERTRLRNPTLYKPVFKAAILAASLAIALFSTTGFFSNSPESYTLTNSFFAVLIAFSAVCFSFSRSVEDEALADRLAFAGERFLHGGILVISTTAIRYVIFSLTSTPSLADIHIAVAIPLGLLLAVLLAVFFNGIIFASTGLRVLSDVLNDRMFRHDDWDDIV